MISRVQIALFLLLIGGLLQCSFAQKGYQKIPPESIPPYEVTVYSANRTNRYHHNSFHNVRMNWPLLDEIEQKQIADLGWEPVFKSFAYIDGDINQPITLFGPGGEDFIYMHRKMIAAVNGIATAAGSSWQVSGWDACPPPGDATWPVPDVPVTGNSVYEAYLLSYKTDDFYNNMIVPAQNELANTTYLATLTLGDLGIKLEYELHTYFHVRFSAYNPIGYRVQSLHPFEYIAEKWDNVYYDYLADFYSAHVNPTFWKIHGWIEKRVADWEAASGNTISISTWKSTWESGPMNDNIIQQLYVVSQDAKYRMRHANDSDVNAGAIIAAVLGGIVIALVILALGYLMLQKMTTGKYTPVKSADTATNRA